MYSKNRTNKYLAYWIVLGITGLLFAGCAGRPQFYIEPQYLQIYENVTKDSFLFELRATDTKNPNNAIRFSTFSAETFKYVTVNPTNNTNPSTAIINLKEMIDREEHEGGIVLNFSATDTIGDVDLKSVRLFILDVCDSTPIFSGQPYVFEIEEKSVIGSIAVYSKIYAKDMDNGNNAVVTYTMKPKTESDYWRVIYNRTFRIDPDNGTVFLEQSLDYEENSFYQFIIEAHDPCNLSAIPEDLTIKVKDVQDQPPFFEGLPYMATLNEGNYTHKHLLQVRALDGDRGIPNTVQYFLVNDSKCSKNTRSSCFCEDLFNINNLTGNISVSGNLDWGEEDVQNIFGICTITIKAKEDNNQHGATESNTTVTLTIIDINNHPPQFSKKLYNATIQENSAKNTLILLKGETSIEVLDKDQGINSKFKITLKCDSKMDCETFEAVPTTIVKEGVVNIRVNNNSLLDYEQRQSIKIIVIAQEELNATHSDTATVVVTIENVNEYSPEFDNETYEAHIQEGAINGTLVINVTATDKDRNGSSQIVYTLSGGNNSFLVDKRTGQVVTNCAPKDLDREQQQDIYLRLTATDEGGRMNQAQLIIHLLDVNDNAPVFQLKRYTAILDENSTTFINESFLIVKATDIDEGDNSTVLYKIEAINNLDRNFTINNETGEMRLVYMLDYEALDDQCNGVINVTVFAYNPGSQNISGNVTVTIILQDVNDNAPQFSQNGYIGTIKENAVEGTVVAKVSATDGDKTSRNKQISFAVGTFDSFQINSSTGIVSVQTGAHFDSDKISSYNLIIIAIDQGANPYTSTTTLNVTIEDVNNKPPEFMQINCIKDVREDSTIGSLVVTCDAKDPDKNSSLRYSIRSVKGLDQNDGTVQDAIVQLYIRIDEKNGTLYVNSTLDRETVAKLEMTIFVNDTGAEDNTLQIATATVTITVLDVDDNPPRFKQGSDLRIGIRRNMESGKEIFEMKNYVTDVDSRTNAIDKWKFEMFTFQITSDLEKSLSGLKREDRCNYSVCVTQNGTIVNNMYYTQDISGFFNVTVLVKDDAGNDTAYCLIFLIADSQVLKMTLQGSRTNVATIKDEILSDCTNVTGLLFVYDSIADHKADDGTVDTLKTDLFFHIQDHKNNKVLSAEEAKRLLDEYADRLYYARMKHRIVSIESSQKSVSTENESTKTIYVMAAVIALLTLVVLIVGYVFFSSSVRYKRKLRAAMPPEKEVNKTEKDDFILPGSNIYAHKENPLLNAPHAPPGYEEIDATSENSLDKNDVDDAEISQEDELEEREVTLDMYGEDYFTQTLTDDPLEAALREHEAQKQSSMHKPDDARVGYSKTQDDVELMVNGFVNNGFHHNLELETSDI